MPTIIPDSEKVKKALKWIAAELMEDEVKRTDFIIQEAATRFNLSPKDEEFLRAFYSEK